MLMTFNPAINGWAITSKTGFTACRVMAKRLRDVCALPESECSGAPDAASSSATCRGQWRNCASFFVAFDYSDDALREIDRFFRDEHKIIIPLTVREILDEEIARKLA